MITASNKILAEDLARMYNGVPVQIVWERPPHVRNARGLVERLSESGKGARIWIDPGNRFWVETLVHELAHLILHRSTIPVTGTAGAMRDWRPASSKQADSDLAEWARRREREAEDWAAAVIDSAMAFVPAVVNGRYLTKDESDEHLLRALCRSI